MIDIFDIINERKDIRINIEGTVYGDSLFYDIEYINEFTTIILDNQKEVEFETFNVTEHRDNEPELISIRDMHVRSLRPSDISIEFDIDIRITNKLYKMFDEDMIGFINYHTKGAIRYDGRLQEAGITTDRYEEYNSRPVRSSRTLDWVDWEELLSSTRPTYDFGSVIPANWEWDEDIRERRSTLRIHDNYSSLAPNHDADGDIIHAAEFRATDMRDMFSDIVLNLGSFGRPSNND